MLLDLSRLDRASSAEIIVQVLYQGVLMSGVALIAFNRAVGFPGAGAATAVIALLPAVAALLAIPILDETPTPFEGLAFIIIAAGVLLAATGNASTSRITTASALEPR